MQKLSSFGQGKTIRPKKSLTRLLHEALQLFLARFLLNVHVKNKTISGVAWHDTCRLKLKIYQCLRLDTAISVIPLCEDFKKYLLLASKGYGF